MSAWISLATAILIVPVLVFAWYLTLHPDWMPDKPDFSSHRRGFAAALIAWSVFVLFMKVPIWLRLPFLFWAGLKLLQVFGRLLLYAFDQKPDFIVSEKGIGGWDGPRFRFVPWSEVKQLNIVRHQNRILGSDIGKPQEWLEFRGPEAGERRFFGTLPPRQVRITYSQMYFATKNAVIIEKVRRYRPDLI